MAMLNVQKNIASEMQAIAVDMLRLKNRLAIAVAMFSAESMNALVDADYAELAELAHVTAQEMIAAKNAMDAINVAVGEYVAGTNSTKLMRIINVVPK
jgi:hypothetical protein